LAALAALSLAALPAHATTFTAGEFVTWSQAAWGDVPACNSMLLALPRSRPKRRRTHVLPPQGLPQDRDQIRPPRPKLPRRRLSRSYRQLLVV